MFDLLKSFFDKVEGLKGKKLVLTLVIVFFIFIIIGISIGYFMTKSLRENENSNMNPEPSSPAQVEKIYYEGKVGYVNPQKYPMDDVSYALFDYSGNEVILLKSRDQKLSIVEGLNVKVAGKVGRMSDGKTDVLIVEEVIIKSAAD